MPTADFASASKRPAIPCARRAGSSGRISATRKRSRPSAVSVSWTLRRPTEPSSASTSSATISSYGRAAPTARTSAYYTATSPVPAG